jgi:hypothetical protein
LALGVWFEFTFNDADTKQLLGLEGPYSVLYAMNRDYHRYLPLVIAVMAYLTIRYVRRFREHDSIGALLKSTGIVLAVIVVSVVELMVIPGTVPGRFVPAAVAIPLALFRRTSPPLSRVIFRGAGILGPPRPRTMAGFRPSRRALLRPRGWVALRACRTADPRFPGWTVNIDADLFGRAAETFKRMRDARSEAYVVARAIEYLLRNNRFSDAEVWVRRAAEPPVCDQPAAAAAAAQFYVAVGFSQRAYDEYRRAGNLTGRRVPAAMSALHAEVALDLGIPLDTLEHYRRPVLRRLLLIWRRQEVAVVLELVAILDKLAEEDPEGVLPWLYEVEHLAADMAEGLDSPDPADAGRLIRARGLALMAAGSVYERKSAYGDAGSAYMDAKEILEQVLDRTRAATCLVLACVHAVRAGYDHPPEENHALDLIRVGLQLIENDRGRLRHQDHRASWIRSQRELHATVFQMLAEGIQYHKDKAAELALWLLESLHRSALASILGGDSIQNDPALAAATKELHVAEGGARLGTAVPGLGNPEQPSTTTIRANVLERFNSVQEAELVTEPTDIDLVLGLIGDGVGLVFHCWRDSTAWTVHSTVVSHTSRITVHRATIAVQPTYDESSWLFDPACVLDAIQEGNAQQLTLLYHGVGLDDDVWRRLARAILPPSLKTVLARAEQAARQTPRLLIVPDGPIAGIPFAALPLTDGSMLIEHAVVCFTPALSLLHQPGADKRRPSAPFIAVSHIDDQALEHAGTEIQAWTRAQRRMEVRHTSTRTELEHALRALPSPDLAVISTHGEPGQGARLLDARVLLRDGSVISAAAARGLPWPAVVVLGACWITTVEVRAGRTPAGFPIMCMLGGARTVIGGTAPIQDRSTARIVARVVAALASPETALSVVRQEIMRELSLTRDARDQPPSSWAAITAWTVQPSRPYTAGRPLTSHWTSDGLPRKDLTPRPRMAFSRPPSEVLEGVLTHAGALSGNRVVGTVEFLAATSALDNGDWTAFLVGACVGPPTVNNREQEGEGTAAITGDPDVLITDRLFESIVRGERLATLLNDESLQPRHVIYGTLTDKRTAACQLLMEGGCDQHQLVDLLGTRVFATDLQTVDVITDSREYVGRDHELRLHGNPGTFNWKTGTALGVAAVVLMSGIIVSCNFLGDLVEIAPENGYMGVAMEVGPTGPVVVGVAQDGPADRAGIRSGDIVVSVADVPLDRGQNVGVIVRVHEPGETIEVTVDRDGAILTFQVTLAQLPDVTPSAP